MSKEQCEKCVYAVWFEDRSVGMWPCIEDCECPYDSRGRGMDALDEETECPFFIQRYTPEYLKHRCKKCKSANN